MISAGVWQLCAFRNKTIMFGEELLVPHPTPMPFRLSATAYSIYSQLPSILQAVLPSATCHAVVTNAKFHGICLCLSVNVLVFLKYFTIKNKLAAHTNFDYSISFYKHLNKHVNFH